MTGVQSTSLGDPFSHCCQVISKLHTPQLQNWPPAGELGFHLPGILTTCSSPEPNNERTFCSNAGPSLMHCKQKRVHVHTRSTSGFSTSTRSFLQGRDPCHKFQRLAVHHPSSATASPPSPQK